MPRSGDFADRCGDIQPPIGTNPGQAPAMFSGILAFRLREFYNIPGLKVVDPFAAPGLPARKAVSVTAHHLALAVSGGGNGQRCTVF